MSDFLNKYPYTDFHELNLDWVIERVKKLTEDWQQTSEAWTGVQQDWADTEQAWIDFKGYVENYLANLDVQDEIDHKIDQMVTDGSLRTLIQPDVLAQTISTTTDWLNDHITQPTTPVIDNTFTIAHAGADAVYTGLLIGSIYDPTADYNMGDYAIYNGSLYRAQINMTPGGTFTPSNWEHIDTTSEIVRNRKFAAKIGTSNIYTYGFDAVSADYKTINAINGIKDVMIEGNLIPGGLKVLALLDTIAYPKTIQLGDSNNVRFTLTYDPVSGWNILEGDTYRISILYDWDNYSEQINVLYADATISFNVMNLANMARRSAIISECDVTMLDAIADVSYERTYSFSDGTSIAVDTTLSEKVIKSDGTLANYNLTNILLHPVSAGMTYHISGNSTKVGSGYIDIGFTLYDNPTKIDAIADPVIDRGMYYTDMLYRAHDNGYIAICHFIGEADNLTVSEIDECSLNIQASTLEDVFRDSFYTFPGDEMTKESLSGKYIDSDNVIKNISNPIFNVKWYRVTKGTTINLSGNARIEAALPMAGFSRYKEKVETLLIDSSHATEITNYNITYVAPDNGFMIVAFSSQAGRGELKCNEPVFVSGSGQNNRALKIQVFGDSITDDYNNTWAGHTTWLGQIKTVMYDNNLTVINSAYGGSSLTNKNSNSVVNRVASLLDPTADVITVWAGTNDWADGNVAIGDLSSADTTIVGAVKSIIEYISQNTSALLIFATPMQRYTSGDAALPTNADGEPLNALSETLKDVCEAISSTCSFYGIPCIDFNSMLGINRLNVSSFTGDGLHPNSVAGNRRIASLFGSEINKYNH